VSRARQNESTHLLQIVSGFGHRVEPRHCGSLVLLFYVVDQLLSPVQCVEASLPLCVNFIGIRVVLAHSLCKVAETLLDALAEPFYSGLGVRQDLMEVLQFILSVFGMIPERRSPDCIASIRTSGTGPTGHVFCTAS
jgi:hypothetical protein